MRTGPRRRPVETDIELVDRARAGAADAFDELYLRHHPQATRLARWLVRSRHDADDAVADAFAAVLQAMRNGNGPHDDFRAYLLACVRNACSLRRVKAMRSTSLEAITDVGIDAAAGVSLEDPERYVEADTVARAFASLPPRWQQALWLGEVEQRSVDEIGAQLGLRANAVAALAYRAREGFASAYLNEHISHSATPACVHVGAKLGAYVRGRAGADTARIEQHLLRCAECARAYDELADMNASLRSLEGPSVGAALAASTAAVTMPIVGGLAALVGSGVAVKAIAAALVLVPTLAFGVHRVDGAAVPRPVIVAAVAPLQAGTAAGTGLALPHAVMASDDVPATPSTGMADTTVAAPATAGSATAGSATAGSATAGSPSAAVDATPSPTVTIATRTATIEPVVDVLPTTQTVVILPPISTPVVSLPAVSTPAVSTPPISSPAVTLTVPVPVVSLPVVVPAVSVPPIVLDVPSISVPSIVVPAVTVPSVVVPSVALPALTVPVPLADVTVPGVG